MFSLTDCIDFVSAAGPAAKKYWREIALGLLALGLLVTLSSRKETIKKLTVETEKRTTTETNLRETREALAMRETQVTQAETQTHTLEQRLHNAESRTRIEKPVLLGNGTVANETTEVTTSTTDTESQERSFMELRLQRLTEERDLALSTIDTKRAESKVLAQRITELEESRPMLTRFQLLGGWELASGRTWEQRFKTQGLVNFGPIVAGLSVSPLAPLIEINKSVPAGATPTINTDAVLGQAEPTAWIGYNFK